MLPGQKARLQGFNASLKMRGVELTLLPSGPTYPALIQGQAADEDRRTLSNAEREMAVIFIKKESLGSRQVTVGDAFKSIDGLIYRVVKAPPQPTDIAMRFTCEVAAFQ